MKRFFIALAFVISFSANAQNYGYIITGYKQLPMMDYQFELIVKEPALENHRLLLDCQSFINGIYYMKYSEEEWKNIWFIMLSGSDCENAFYYTRTSLGEQGEFCLTVDVANEHLDFHTNPSECK